MIRKGCRNCRRRHIKCVLPDGAAACEKCTDLGRRCELEPRFRFKDVRYVYQKEKDGSGRSKFVFAWDRRQAWMRVSNPISFVIERWDAQEWVDAQSALGDESENPDVATSPVQQNHPSASPACSPDEQFPAGIPRDPHSHLSPREAFLLRSYIIKLAPWVCSAFLSDSYSLTIASSTCAIQHASLRTRCLDEPCTIPWSCTPC